MVAKKVEKKVEKVEAPEPKPVKAVEKPQSGKRPGRTRKPGS